MNKIVPVQQVNLNILTIREERQQAKVKEEGIMIVTETTARVINRIKQVRIPTKERKTDIGMGMTKSSKVKMGFIMKKDMIMKDFMTVKKMTNPNHKVVIT